MTFLSGQYEACCSESHWLYVHPWSLKCLFQGTQSRRAWPFLLLAVSCHSKGSWPQCENQPPPPNEQKYLYFSTFASFQPIGLNGEAQYQLRVSGYHRCPLTTSSSPSEDQSIVWSSSGFQRQVRRQLFRLTQQTWQISPDRLYPPFYNLILQLT